jgi:PKD repeat protein
VGFEYDCIRIFGERIFLFRWIIPVLLILGIIIGSAGAATTQVTVRRYAWDGLTPIIEVTRTYQQLESQFNVSGDGNTYYYFQGPVFENEWEAHYGVSFPDYHSGGPTVWNNSHEKWDRIWNTSSSSYDLREEVNWATKNLGKLKGTNVWELCQLVGGLPVGKTVRVLAADNVYKELPYEAIYTPNPHLGPYVITWWSVGAGEGGEATNGYTGPDYTNGMRATFFADASRNPDGKHVAGLGDMAEGLPPVYWYHYTSDNIYYPSMGGFTLKYVDRVYVFSNDPVPPPVADFSGNIIRGHIANGNFETKLLSPWVSQNASIFNTTPGRPSDNQVGIASAKLEAKPGVDAWIQQDVDLTDVGRINFWRTYYGSYGKYMDVYIDNTRIARYTDTISIYKKYESIDITSFGFTGTHTLKFYLINYDDSPNAATFTVYLDEILDCDPGTSGVAPLTIQFSDLTTNMQNLSKATWSWSFGDGYVSSLSQPRHTYTTPGTYTVSLTATNNGGSDTETKTAYITVTGTPTISIDATGEISDWDFALGENENTTAVVLSVTTTASNWHVSVKDALYGGKPALTEGKMVEYDGSTYVSSGRVLTNALQVKSGTRSYVTLSGTDQEVQSGTSSGNYDIGLKQVIAAGDPALTASHVYRIVITFTGFTD